ncbi:hypothetical protein H2201_001609 [Coniosporium apollinis]|uniref:A to I editase domain-containing protein n=2 Tax=Coniosporium TaxID=2810619 RepID=A0ABQ9P0T1_9PEZI|nr:hypothetical protein H2199_007498 [Cladosporium sp. JES 115]KAJ9668180.1 hypothetical protein H2201_001609 [Coniosporium apollinis]
MKCLPSSKLPLAHGNVLHDWHAEILAIRAFNSFLVKECANLLVDASSSTAFIRQRDEAEMSSTLFQPFAIKDDVGIHMYCSEAPCGDASMELTMDAQDDPTPWDMPLSTNSATAAESPDTPIAGLHGRGYFSELGVVRRKPSRPDAPPTLSKSCTDKLALKQCTSLLSSLMSLLLVPTTAYLHTLVLPASQHVPAATERAFGPGGRMSALSPCLTGKWEGGYKYTPFEVKSTSKEFEWSRRSEAAQQKMIGCNLSAVYTPYWQETVIGGVLQGRKQFDPKGASRICRRNMWMAVADIAAVLATPALVRATRKRRYAEVKDDGLQADRRKVIKDAKGMALKGWVENAGDGIFALDESSRV